MTSTAVASKQLVPSAINMVIYHDPCNDGFGAAYAVWRYMRDNGIDHDIEWVPAGYNAKAPDVTGKDVLIADFSFQLKTLNKMLQKSNSLLVIDHHKTADKQLAEFPEEHKIFDMNRSGAVLTWQWLFPNVEVPLMFQYIEDRDIWKKALPNTDEFNAWFFQQERDFETYDRICRNLNGEIDAGIKVGEVYVAKDRMMTDELAARAVPKLVRFKTRTSVRYAVVGHINSIVLKSDVGNRMFDFHPYIDAAAVYSVSDNTGMTNFSLRSTDLHIDVGALAKEYLGGGGHRNAAGTSIPAIVDCVSSKCYGDFAAKLVKRIYNIGDTVYLNAAGTHAYGEYLLQEKAVVDGRTVNSAESILALNALSEDITVDWKPGSHFSTCYRAALQGIPEIKTAVVWMTDGKITSQLIYFPMRRPLTEIKKRCKELGLKMETSKQRTFVRRVNGVQSTL